jgi:pimeloyl-ACP methyl ester carboxylesterase
VSTLVVYVHGLWLNGWESALLRKRLSRELECQTLSFPYSSMSADLGANALALAKFLGRFRTDTLHLVGHSMGGLVILELFDRLESGRLSSALELPPGRVVLVGSPVRGSRAARRLARLPWGLRMLGHTAREVLLPRREPVWRGTRELGVIAGSLPVGFGRLVGSFNEPNDGTVMVSETRLAGACQHLVVHTSHSALVYSRTVARHIGAFLRHGRFIATEAGDS